MPSQRVSPPRISPAAAAAPRPGIGAPGADAHRQTGFTLGAEVALVVDGLNLEGAAAEASSDARHRSHTMAAALGPWSRSWLCRLEALHATQAGNYVAAFPLIRAAADAQAAVRYFLQTEASEWVEWLDGGGVALAPEEHALAFRLHAFRAAEVLAAGATLGPVYRAATALSLPHFGATLLLAGNDSDPSRIAMTFGDRDFHLGLAELAMGSLLLLGAAQVETLREFDGVLALPNPDAAMEWASLARAAAARRDRCTIEELDPDGETRLLVQNWRRQPGGAPKKIIL